MKFFSSLYQSLLNVLSYFMNRKNSDTTEKSLRLIYICDNSDKSELFSVCQEIDSIYVDGEKQELSFGMLEDSDNELYDSMTKVMIGDQLICAQYEFNGNSFLGLLPEVCVLVKDPTFKITHAMQ